MPGWSAHRPAHGGHVDHASRRGCIRGGRLARHDARDAVELLWPPPSGFSGERGPGHAPETPQKWVNGNRTETHQREVSSRNFNGLGAGNFFREQGVGSSNLPAPTNKINDFAFRIPRHAPETAPETEGARRMAPRAMSGFAPEFVAAFQWPVLKRKTSPAAAGGDSRSGAGGRGTCRITARLPGTDWSRARDL